MLDAPIATVLVMISEHSELEGADARIAQMAEHVLGKNEVTSPSLVPSSGRGL